MAVLIWPATLKAPFAYSPGVTVADVRPASLGAKSDTLHRFALRTMTFEWRDMAHDDFTRIDALVDLLGQRRGTIKVPWRSYQNMLGGGTGVTTVNGAHLAGDTTLSVTGWGGTNPVVTFGDMIQIGAAVPRLHRVLAPASHSAGVATISIEPGLWRDYSNGEAVYHLRHLDGTNPQPYLVVTMELADPSQVQGQVYASPTPQYGRGFVISFIEAIRVNY